MSINIKVVLRKDKIPHGNLYPLMVRITIDRKIQYVSIKKYCEVEQWNETTQKVSKKNRESEQINLLIGTVLSDVNFFMVSEAKTKNTLSFESLKAVIRKSLGQESIPKSNSIFEMFKIHIAYLKKNNRLGYAEAFTSTQKSIANFCESADLSFNMVDTEFLRNYEDYLNSRGCKITTCSLYFRTFRTLWNVARRDGFCPKDLYPFKDFPFAKYNNPKTKKRAISKTQIDSIEYLELDPQKDTLINSRNYFLFSFYCRGLNFTDLAELKWGNIKDGELNYTRSKTKDEFNFKLHEKATKILNYYKNLEGNSDAGFIFPILYKRHASLQSIRDRKKKILKRVNSDIKHIAKQVGIEKKITTYVARHSFATALLGKGFSKEDIGKTLQHEDLKTTSIYLDEIDNPYFDDNINSAL